VSATDNPGGRGTGFLSSARAIAGHLRRTPGRKPGYIAHSSMPAFARWWYFHLLATLLRPFPRPVWHVPAAAHASVRVLFDAEGRRLSVALLRALDMPVTWRARWRLHWMHWYQREAILLLCLQSPWMTRAWAKAHIRPDGALPRDGAIVLIPHHTGQQLGALVVAGLVDRFGGIAWRPPDDPAQFARMDETIQELWPHIRRIRTRAVDDRAFLPQEAALKGLRLLKGGGSLMMAGDVFTLGERRYPFLGRARPMPSGVTWFARQSGKPIHPCMIVPEGREWRLWIGPAIPPTQEAVIAAMEECIRRAPSNWERSVAMSWLHAPRWRTTGANDGR
jgi:hypothetical protein